MKRYPLSVLLLGFFLSQFALANDQVQKDKAPVIGRLYWVGGNQLWQSNPDGSETKVLRRELDAPDGLVVELAKGEIYWTNMSRGPNGSLQRSRLDGSKIKGDGEFLVKPASFETGKEIEIDPLHEKLYWADRDGRKILRANLDGSDIEVVLQSFTDENGATKSLENPVGVAIDSERRHLYLTDRFMAAIMRLPMDAPLAKAPRADVDQLIVGDRSINRPIDIDLDLQAGAMYWTDRGSHQVLRSKLDGSEVEVLVDASEADIRDPIGISLDTAAGVFYWTDMSTHGIFVTDLSGRQTRALKQDEALHNGLGYGPLGIAFVSHAVSPAQGNDKMRAVRLIGNNFVDGKTQLHVNGEAVDVQVLSSELLQFNVVLTAAESIELRLTTPSGSATRPLLLQP